MPRYDFKKVEAKWQKFWEENKTFATPEEVDKDKKKYILDMFPYPSGAGLHVGHVESYTATDIYARFLRMNGYQVLHPQGFDAFGLPAENFAIKNNVHPLETTQKAIATFKKQINSLGFSYDWERQVVSSEPDYYKWTQWLFLQLYKNNLAYRKTANVNWCDSCQTVLANEQAEGGKCERCDSPVVQKDLEQWFFRITAFIEGQEYEGRHISGLLNGLKKIDWPDSTKAGQKNWIGKSVGAEVDFEIEGEKVTVFTTRPDTLFGATYFVLSPEHKLVQDQESNIENIKEVKQYIKKTKAKTDLERTDLNKEKTGVKLEGVYAVNPVNNKKIPVFIADYVLSSYGTGAIMAVPAHDERDFEFAQKYDLPIVPVVSSDIQSYQNISQLLEALKEISKRAEERGIKFWLLGSVAIAFRVGAFYREISDIDMIVRDKENLEKVSGLLKEIGFERQEDHKLTPRLVLREFKNRNGIKVSLGEFNHEFGIQESDLEDKVLDFNNIKMRVASKRYLHDFKKWQLDNEEEEKDKHRLDVKFLEGQVLSEDGIAINSDFLNDLPTPEAKKKIIAWLEEQGQGREAVNYRLRDWLVSRQRYWGAPIPVIHCDRCGTVPVPEKDLPVMLPSDVDFKPTGESPLRQSASFYKTECPSCGQEATREVDTMDTFVCSSWYYLRYADPHNYDKFASKDKLDTWLPVDVYVGGAEHTVLHLLYARFFTKFLYKYGYLEFDEPFTKMRHQGIILAEDGTKMSKSKGNVVNPDDVVAEFGADALRMYEMFMGPLEDMKPWNTKGIVGISRFLDKVWNLAGKCQPTNKNNIGSETSKVKGQKSNVDPKSYLSTLHKAIKKVTEDIEEFKFNTAIAQMMILAKEMEAAENMAKEDYEKFILILSPFAPHLCEELWQKLGHKHSLSYRDWPAFDPELVKDETYELIIQINGKLRDKIKVEAGTTENQAQVLALASEKIQAWTNEREIVSVHFVEGKLINIVVK